MVRAPCCEKMGLKKGPWTQEEDHILVAFIQNHGHDNWRQLPKKAGLLRCGKSCRLRWINYLRPDIKRGNFSKEEEDTIIKLHQKLGNRWSAIAAELPGRTDNEIKNVWHTHLKKPLAPKLKHPKRSRKAKAAVPTSGDQPVIDDGHDFMINVLDPVSPADDQVTDLNEDFMDSLEEFPAISDQSFWSEILHLDDSISSVTNQPTSSSSDLFFSELISRSSSETAKIAPRSEKTARRGGQLLSPAEYCTTDDHVTDLSEDFMDSLEELPAISDQSFWSEILHLDDSISSFTDQPSSSSADLIFSEPTSRSSSENCEEVKDFWLQVFMEAEGFLPLPADIRQF